MREAVEGHVFEEAEGGDQRTSSFSKEERERERENGCSPFWQRRDWGERAQGGENALLRNVVPGKKERFLCERVCLSLNVPKKRLDPGHCPEA